MWDNYWKFGEIITGTIIGPNPEIVSKKNMRVILVEPTVGSRLPVSKNITTSKKKPGSFSR